MKAVLLLALLLPGLACAQEARPDPQALTPAEWYARVVEAAQRGESQVVNRLFTRESPPPPEGVARYRYYTDLARAALSAEWFTGVQYFIRQAGRPPDGQDDLRWLSGLACAYTGDWKNFHEIVAHYQAIHREHPAANYLLGTLKYLEWRRLGPLHPEAAALYAEADGYSDRALHYWQDSQKFKPDDRFWRLRASVTEFAPAEDAYGRAGRFLASGHPYDLRLLRVMFATSRRQLGLDTMSLHLARARLSAEEKEMWQRFETAGQDLDPATAGMQAQLAQLPATPEFDEARRHYLREEFKASGVIARVEAWHAEHPAGADPAASAARGTAYRALAEEFGPAYPALLATYAQLAAASGNPADCYFALRLMDAHLTRPDADRAALAPLEITLAAQAGDRPRAIALVKARADANATNVAWWQEHARLMLHHADLVTAFIYFRQRASLMPDNLTAQFDLVSLADRDVEADLAAQDLQQLELLHQKFFALTPEEQAGHRYRLLASSDARDTAYAELFQQVPARGVPPTAHWEAYEKLLQSREESLLRASDTSAAPPGTAYRQLVERCYREKPSDKTILREARKVRTAEALRLARATLKLQPGPDGEAAKARYQAALAAAQEAGVTDAALEPAREAFAVYALREESAAAAARTRAELADASRAAPATPAGLSPLARRIVDAYNARVRRIEGLKPSHEEAAAASWTRNDFRTQQAKQAIARKEDIKRHLCQHCKGHGLLVVINATRANLRPCLQCNRSGMNDSWTEDAAKASYPDFTQIDVPRSAIEP